MERAYGHGRSGVSKIGKPSFKTSDPRSDRPSTVITDRRKFFKKLLTAIIAAFFDVRGEVSRKNDCRKLLNETDWGGVDILVVDTPPGTGDILLSLAQSVHVTGMK